MPRAASLPGAELFLRNPTCFCEQATCPGQRRCLGQNFFSKTTFFCSNKPLVPGSFAAWGRTFSQKSDFLFEEATCPGQLRCLGQIFLRNPTFFEEATCPGQLRCLGQILFSEIRLFLKKPLVPGRFAAWGRTFSQKSACF